MTPLQVLKLYALKKVKRIKKITAGLVHTSYRIDTLSGTYLLQRLHPRLANRAFTADYQRVTEYLKGEKFLSQEVVTDRKGRLQIPDQNTAWRLLTFIPGKTYATISRASQAKKLGFALGTFHLALKNFPYRFHKPLALHDTRLILHRLASTIKKHAPVKAATPILQDALFLKKNIPPLLLPRALPKRAVHCDPKVSNFVFTSNGKVVLIDLDTCARDSSLVDLGDALRSWCATKAMPGKPVHFRGSFFKAALQGYYAATKKLLSEREWSYIVQATKLITLELAARFLIDYFEDAYFAWDPIHYTSRREHNLRRYQRLIILYNEITKKQKKLEQMVTRIFKKK